MRKIIHLTLINDFNLYQILFLFSKARNNLDVTSSTFDFVAAHNDSITTLFLLCNEASYHSPKKYINVFKEVIHISMKERHLKAYFEILMYECSEGSPFPLILFYSTTSIFYFHKFFSTSNFYFSLATFLFTPTLFLLATIRFTSNLMEVKREVRSEKKVAS